MLENLPSLKHRIFLFQGRHFASHVHYWLPPAVTLEQSLGFESATALVGTLSHFFVYSVSAIIAYMCV